MKKPILCLDFDGVIHSYSSGWQGADVVGDLPVEGATSFIESAVKTFRVAIYSSRSGQPGGIQAMQRWLSYYMLLGRETEKAGAIMEALEWPTEKPPAQISIDDRALTFDGTWPDVDSLMRFQPWNKRQTTEFGSLSGAAKDVMMQLFVKGPTWDGNVAAKSGRGELCEMGLAEHRNGWAYLTRSGVAMAITADVKNWNDRRWHEKQNGM